jgi:hypothetical protein
MAEDASAVPAGAAGRNGRYFIIALRAWSAVRAQLILDGFDFTFLIVLIVSSLGYHSHARYWSGQVTIGNWQYGDAEFWWNGAIQFAEGIVRENPNLTYRMGYAVVAGLWISLFGTNFSPFHTFLLALHIVAWYALYLALRPSLGKIAAAVGILLAVLNPFTAEWLSISTSDSVGLLFNIWALVFLLVGLRRGLSPAWLAGSGMFVAFASLTRPLMTPFLAPALLLPLLAIHVGWRRRGRAVVALLVAFVVPAFIWIGILRSLTNEWRLAGSDAATFYAASDPQVQVWTPGMFAKVEGLAKARFNVSQATQSQLDQEFWRLTSDNYFHFAGYHLRRIVPHVVEIADMSIEKASHVSGNARLVRLLILAAFGILLAIRLFRRSAMVRGSLALGIVIAWMYPPLASWIVLLALVSGIPLALWNKSDWGGAVLIMYWCAGAGALYLVGGTWGPPLSPVKALNSLGYRLGAQFFFVADLIVLHLIHNICIFRTSGIAASKEFSLSITGKLWSTPRRWASTTVSAALLIWFGLICSEVTAGAAVVTYRWISRSTREAEPFPDLSPVLTMCLEHIQQLLPTPRFRLGGDETTATLQKNEDSPYVLTTGASTDFIWNLNGQDRTKALITLQSRVFPFDFSSRVFVDFPAFLSESDWARRQGAFLLRRFKDDPAPSNFPWYFSDIGVRAFVPIEGDGKNFEMVKARWFPVVKYASQLHSANALLVENGTFEQSATSGTEHYPRRFAVHLSAERDAGPPSIVIDAAKALGVRTLKFGWQSELTPGELPRKLTLLIQRYPLKSEAGSKPTEGVEEFAAASNLPPIRKVSLDLGSPPIGRVRLTFGGLRPGETVWIYELNLTAEDWDW